MTPAERFAFVSRMREQGQEQFEAVRTAANGLLGVLDAERYELLVDFGDGRFADLVTVFNAGRGPGMMMPMMGPRHRPAGTVAAFMRFKPDAALKAVVTRLPRQLATLASPDEAYAGAART